MKPTYSDEIEWDNDTFEVFETDIDGHGTRVGSIRGFVNTGAGKTEGVEEYRAEAFSHYPYDDIEVDGDTIEFIDFAPNEPDEED